MTLRDSVELWEIQTNRDQSEYLHDCVINELVNKETLWEFLMMEYMDMKVVDSDSRFFHERVKNFFLIHKFNIDGLCETMEMEYDPLDNAHWVQNEKTVEHNTRDRDDNWQRTNETTRTDEWLRTYGEDGNNSETDVNFVSAYNDEHSPEQIGVDSLGRPIYRYNDEEKSRTQITKNYSLDGEEDKDETITQNDNEDKKEQEDIVDDKDKKSDITWSGNKGQSYQSLIDEQRRVVEFNIYKWIARHFCKELLIAVW